MLIVLPVKGKTSKRHALKPRVATAERHFDTIRRISTDVMISDSYQNYLMH